MPPHCDTLDGPVVKAAKQALETGNINLKSCAGSTGTVYLDIPAGGAGEVRVMCGGTMSVLKARAAGGVAIKAGAPVRVVRVVEANAIEVELDSTTKT